MSIKNFRIASRLKCELIPNHEIDLILHHGTLGAGLRRTRRAVGLGYLRACLKTGEWRDAGPRIPGRQEPAALQ